MNINHYARANNNVKSTSDRSNESHTWCDQATLLVGNFLQVDTLPLQNLTQTQFMLRLVSRTNFLKVSVRRMSGPTEEQKTLVEESWNMVKDLGLENVGILLFKNVFTIAPEALQLFSFRDEPNLYESPIFKWHGKNVVTHVGHAVAGLRTLDKLVPVLQKLGKKHDHRDIIPAHFDVVGQALIQTLEQGLGDKCTPEVKEAWATTYKLIADVMMAEMSTCQAK